MCELHPEIEQLFAVTLLFHTPLVYPPSFVSEFYHDYYRWPLKEKRIYERWREEMPWGQLFARYLEQGHLGK